MNVIKIFTEIRCVFEQYKTQLAALASTHVSQINKLNISGITITTLKYVRTGIKISEEVKTGIFSTLKKRKNKEGTVERYTVPHMTLTFTNM